MTSILIEGAARVPDRPLDLGGFFHEGKGAVGVHIPCPWKGCGSKCCNVFGLGASCGGVDGKDDFRIITQLHQSVCA